jgi:predicted MPP superfamily phosphohydrolase
MKQYIPLIFFTVFIGILIAANIYLARRFNFYFNIENTKLLYFLFPALSFLMFFGMMPLSNATSGLASFIYVLAAITMGVLLYLVLSVISVDVANLFLKLQPRTAGIAVLTITFMISAYAIFNSWNTQITNQEVKVKGLTKEIRAMHLSDIHIGHFRGKNFLKKIVGKTNQQNVDVVFITGDLFDGKINLTRKELQSLTQLKAPIYFVEGNHDRYTDVETIKQYLREIDVHVLENEMTNFGDLQIIGLNHMRADSSTFNMHAAGNHSTVQSTLDKLSPDKNKPSVLLHHSPDGVKYANQHGVDLYLAGHTHAGQLFPIIYIANLIFEYNRGMHDYKGTKMFVSEGAGTFGPPMRLGTKSEITVITLKP